MKLKFLLASVTMLLSAMLFGQETNTVWMSGTVKDSKGVALQGINVTEKGTTNATTTNAGGGFIIKTRSTTVTLVFSGIGFKTQEAVAENGKAIEISLSEDVKELADVAVV